MRPLYHATTEDSAAFSGCLRHLKPVAAVREWLAAAGITEGPVFRPINRAGRVRGDARLTDRSVADIVKRYAALAGLEASG
jgi:hypothetical protein